jgi:hypothetical protein
LRGRAGNKACTRTHLDTGVFWVAQYGIDRVEEIEPIRKNEIGPDAEEWVEEDYFPRPDRNAWVMFVLEDQAVFLLGKLRSTGTTKVRLGRIRRAALNAKSLG